MKKVILFLSAICLLATGCQSSDGVNDAGEAPVINPRIATIEEQSANIKATIAKLVTTKSAINDAIASLQSQQAATRGDNNGVKDMIAELEERIADLEQMIAALTSYTDEELASITDWAEATLATMEQYAALAAELAELKTILESIEGVSTEALAAALAAAEESMKQWVNEQFSGYATLAYVDAQMKALGESVTENNEQMQKELEALMATLTTLQSDIEASYKEAIVSAINVFAGEITEQIASEIAAVNQRIDDELATINARLDDIEQRLDEIEEQLKNLVSRIQSVVYVKQYGDNPTPVVTSADGATVTLDFEVSPKSTIEGLSLKWEEYMKVQALYSGSTDFINMPIKSFVADEEKGIITIVASGETLSNEFYTGLVEASLRLEISDGNNDRRSEYIPITPQRWASEGISLTPANNEIYYITTDSNTLYPNSDSDFGAKIVSNTYDLSKGCFVLKFDGDVTHIGDYAYGSSDNKDKTYTTLKYIKLPNSTTHLGYYAFAGCDNLVSIEIPEGTTFIKEGAFRWCTSLESLTIPKTITKIGTYTFWSCSNLKHLYISDLSAWCKIDFVLESELSTSKTVYANPLMKKPILYLNGQEVVELVIPDDITEIKDRAFYGFRGTKVVLHDKITKIGMSAFAVNENLKEINIPNGVTEIGEYAFVSNTSLASISIPNGVQHIGHSTFSQCISLKTIDIPESVTSIGNAAFYKCTSLESITIPSGVTEISERVFDQCTCELIINSKIVETDYTSTDNPYTENGWLYQSKISKITLGDNITKIGKHAFHGYTPLTSINIPNSVTEIRDNAFINCNDLTDIAIPNSVTSIGSYAFYNCRGITSFTIPESITSIEPYTFVGCSSLTSVTIPNSVTSIERNAFSHCGSLTSINIPSSVQSIGHYAFDDCHDITSLDIPESVTSIGSYAFRNCSSLTRVTIPSSITSFGSGAFTGCTGELIVNCNIPYVTNGVFQSSHFTKVTISDNVSVIGVMAFSNSSNLTRVTIGNSVTSIGSSAFLNCSSLTDINIPNSVTSIGKSAFRGCSSLTSVTIPGNVSSIGAGVFQDCSCELIINNKIVETNYTGADNPYTENGWLYASQISKITLGDNITKIGKYAFFNGATLTNISIPDSVTSIGINAFRNCSSLTSVTIGNGVTSIESNAFSGCVELTSITIPESVTSIGNYIFSYCYNLMSIYCKPTTPPTGANYLFDSNVAERKVYVPQASVEAYQSICSSIYVDYVIGYDF